MVPAGGLEPPRPKAGDFESPLSTNSNTLASFKSRSIAPAFKNESIFLVPRLSNLACRTQ